MAEGLLGSREASGALPCGAPAPGFGVPPCAQSGTSCFVEPLLPIWNPYFRLPPPRPEAFFLPSASLAG